MLFSIGGFKVLVCEDLCFTGDYAKQGQYSRHGELSIPLSSRASYKPELWWCRKPWPIKSMYILLQVHLRHSSPK